MKKTREAFISGQKGETAPKDFGKMRRLAHRMGANSLRRMVAQDELQEAAMTSTIDETIARAKGPNKQVLEIIKASKGLPLPNAGSNPHWGYMRTDKDGSNPRKEWYIKLDTKGNDNSTPLVESLGMLDFGVDDPAVGTQSTYVRNLSLHVSAPCDQNGNPTGLPSTEIFVNAHSKDRLFDDPTYTGGVKLTLGQDGEISSLGTTRANEHGYKSEEGAAANLEGFLQGVQNSVTETAARYAEINNLDVLASQV
jgi:hypothetical protein